MGTITDNNETPKRRLEDRLPAETIAWDKPDAPAVPAAPQAQSCAALRHVASMVVNAEGVSVYPTYAAARLEHGHYMLSAPGAQLTTAATHGNCAHVSTDRAAEAAQPASTGDDQWIFDLAAKHEVPGAGLRGPVTLTADGLANFACEFEVELARRGRAQGGNTSAEVSIPAATRPAPLADINAKQLVNDLCNIATIYHGKSALYERMSGAVSQYLATKPAEPVIPAPRGENELTTFLTELTTFAGNMVNGNQLSRRAAELLPIAHQALPTDRDATQDAIQSLYKAVRSGAAPYKVSHVLGELEKDGIQVSIDPSFLRDLFVAAGLIEDRTPEGAAS